jgi:hypothetical protein
MPTLLAIKFLQTETLWTKKQWFLMDTGRMRANSRVQIHHPLAQNQNQFGVVQNGVDQRSQLAEIMRQTALIPTKSLKQTIASCIERLRPSDFRNNR